MSKNARCGVRTHEAYALVLKTNPFDHSGNLAKMDRYIHLISSLGTLYYIKA